MPNKLVYSDIRVINELTAAQLTVHNEYSLPLTDGTANQVMVTDGAGQVQFVDLASISPTPISISNGTGINWSLVGSVYTGNVTLSPFSTTNLAEGVNMYFTYERVDDRVAALIQNGTGISWSYNDIGDTLTPTVTLAPFSTTNLAEGTRLYFTPQRVFNSLLPAIVNAAPSPSNPIVWQYNAGPQTILPKVSLDPFDTDDLSEGSTNCYHTTNRAQDAAATIFTSNPGLHTGIAFSYNTGTNEMTATVSPVPIEVQCNGVACGSQGILNFCAGNDIALTVAEDVINGCVSIQIDSLVATPVIIEGSGTCSSYRVNAGNSSSGDYSAVSGGGSSQARCCYSTVSGGYAHIADGDFSSIGGGCSNCVCGCSSTVSGGACNQVLLNTSNYSTIGGGYLNVVESVSSTISGGSCNQILCNDSNYSFIGGGLSNCVICNAACGWAGADHTGSVIVGGCNNTIFTNSAVDRLNTIGGGCGNCAGGIASTIAGGRGNFASCRSSVLGGDGNIATGNYSAILAGTCNTAGCPTVDGCVGAGSVAMGVAANSTGSVIYVGSNNGVFAGGSVTCRCNNGQFSSVLGGFSNWSSGLLSTVSGGYYNVASGIGSNVNGGCNNTVSACLSTVGGGRCNVASCCFSVVSGGCCNTACGVASAVLGGSGNIACNDYSGVFGCNITTVAACTFHVNNLAVTTAPTVAPSSIALLTRDQTTGVVNTRYMGGLYSQIADGATVANTAVETSIIGTGCGSLTVAANGFTVGDSFEATLAGKVSTGNGQTLTFQLKSGAVVLATTGAITMTNGLSNCSWSIQSHFTIRAIGAAGVATILTNGQFGYNDGTAIKGADFSSLNNTTFDTTISNTLSITATWGAANVLNSFVSCEFVLSKTY